MNDANGARIIPGNKIRVLPNSLLPNSGIGDFCMGFAEGYVRHLDNYTTPKVTIRFSLETVPEELWCYLKKSFTVCNDEIDLYMYPHQIEVIEK